MPKMKTDRGAAKRFRITGTGKIMRRNAFNKHFFRKKSSTRTRRLSKDSQVTGGDARQVRRMLGI